MPEKVNDFSKLDFKQTQMNFKDNRVMYEAGVDGDFTREGLLKNLEFMKDKLKSKKNAMIGCAFHYAKVNDWCPAMLFKVTDPIQLWDVTDSDKVDIYKDDDIDACVFYIIKADDGQSLPTYHKPKKNVNESMNGNECMFKKKKK